MAFLLQLLTTFLTIVTTACVTVLDYFSESRAGAKRWRRRLAYSSVALAVAAVAAVILAKRESDQDKAELYARLDKLQASLDPFVEAARRRHPDARTDTEALQRLQSDLTDLSQRTQLLEERTARRDLKPEQQRMLVRALSKHAGQELKVVAVMGDSESTGFAHSLSDTLRAARWANEQGINEVNFARNPTGLIITHPEVSPPAAAVSLRDALALVGYEVLVQQQPNVELTLYVGVKP